MRQTSRCLVGLIACYCSISAALVGNAAPDAGRDQIPSGPASAIAPSNTENLRVNPNAKPPVDAQEPLPPDLARIINAWQTKSANIKSVCGTYKKSEFIPAFKVERVSEGRFFVESSHRWRFDEWSRNIKKGDVSKRVTKDGGKYRIEPSLSVGSIICTRDIVVMIDDNKKEFREIKLPVNLYGTDAFRCPLPFRLVMNTAEIQSKFKLSLLRETNESAVVVATRLKEATISSNFFMWDLSDILNEREDDIRKLAIALDNKLSRPTAVRLLREGDLEAVYTFDRVTFNDADSQSGHGFPGDDPFVYRPPNGYKRMLNDL
jgi:hypothetical protein